MFLILHGRYANVLEERSDLPRLYERKNNSYEHNVYTSMVNGRLMSDKKLTRERKKEKELLVFL